MTQTSVIHVLVSLRSDYVSSFSSLTTISPEVDSHDVTENGKNVVKSGNENPFPSVRTKTLSMTSRVPGRISPVQ
jgi:hypothetical protein